jgi:uncharacterized protein YuzE
MDGVRINYDASADAAYVYLADEIRPGAVAKTVPVDPLAINGMINLDFDAEGRLLGIEVLAASKRLAREALAAAER